MIENQLKMLSRIVINDVNMQNYAQDFQKSLIGIYEIIQKVNKCFSASLLVSFFCLYTSLMVNVNWTFLHLAGHPEASMEGESFLIVPNI